MIKLEYNINREAAKISALSSGKLHKYEYLTSEDILPSTQQQITEQTKFTYSPLGKAFDKQIKTIEDQGKKQVDALNTLKFDNKIIEKYIYDPKDTPLISRQKEIFNKLIDERLNRNDERKITDLDERVNRNDLIYRYKSKVADRKFDEFDNALDIINKTRKDKKDLADVKNNQQDFKLYLGEIKKGTKKSKEQKNTLYNIEMLYKAGNEAVEFYDDYSLVMSEAKAKSEQSNTTKGTGLKILTPNQMLQRLPIALAQVKVCNNSQNLLNEIRQIICSLYQSKEITKKVYNNLIKSI